MVFGFGYWKRSAVTESPLYGQIMAAFSRGETRVFRQQSLMGWAGKILNKTHNTVTLLNPYAVRVGVPGMADLGGVTSVIITPDMVGQRIGIDLQIECKATGKYGFKEQRDYISAMQALGVRAGFARSVEDARRIIAGVAS